MESKKSSSLEKEPCVMWLIQDSREEVSEGATIGSKKEWVGYPTYKK